MFKTEQEKGPFLQKKKGPFFVHKNHVK